MLRPFSSPEVVIHRLEPPRHPQAADLVSLDTIASTVWSSVEKHWRLILSMTCACAIAAAAYLLVTPPQYTASALVTIDPKGNSTLRTVAVSDANVDSAKIESEVELLKSERILRQVVESEKLVGDPSLAPGLLSATISKITAMVKMGHHDAAADLPDAEVGAAAASLAKLTSVKRLGLTYVVEVTATMLRPVQAAQIANAYAKTYIDDQLEVREDVARQTGTMLRHRTDELQSQAQAAEQAVEQLKFSGSLDGVNSAAARVKLNDLESRAQTYRTLRDKMLEQFTTTWQQQESDLADAHVASAAFPPLSKSAPKSLLILTSGLFIGFFLGTLTAMLSDRRKATSPAAHGSTPG